MISKVISLLYFIFISFSINAVAAKREYVDDIFNKYKSSQLVKLVVQKKVKSELLGKLQVFEGQIFLSKKLFRWDTETPEKSQIIFDGQIIWNIQTPPEEMKSKPIIAKMKVDKNTRKQILISTLLNQDKLTKNFKVISQNNLDDQKAIELEPKTSELNIKKLTIKVDLKTKEISLISYVDDLGNFTEILISKTTFSKTANAKLFSFKPPVGASVTNL